MRLFCQIFLLEHINTSIMDVSDIRQQTRRDPILARVYIMFVQQGWPDTVTLDEMKPSFVRRNKLSSQDDCVLWGSRSNTRGEYVTRDSSRDHQDEAPG